MDKRPLRLIDNCFRVKYYRLALCLSVALIYGAVFFLNSFQATSLLRRKMTYGFHNGCVYQVTDALATRLAGHHAVEQWGIMDVYGKLLDDTKNTVGYIGQMDQGFLEMEQLNLIEGNYPAKASEVAVETALLDLLHIPYELGREITLSIQRGSGKDIQIIQQTFRICGILSSYTANWKSDGEPLCSALISQFDGQPEESHFFFSSIHKNESEMNELVPLLSENERLVYNDYSYPSDDGEQQLPNTIVLLASLAGMLFIACVRMRAYPEQLSRLKILWAIGIERRTFRKLLFRSALGQWAVCMVFTLLGCAVVSFLLQAAAAVTGGLWQFPWCWRAFFLAGGMTCFMVLIGEIVLMTMFGHAPDTTTIRGIAPEGRAERSRPRSRKSFGLEQFCQIQKRRTQRRFWAESVLCLVSVLVLPLCLIGLGNSIQSYRLWRSVNGAAYQWIGEDPSVGLSAAQVSRIKNTKGIPKVMYTTEINNLGPNGSGESTPVILSYEGVEEDPYCQLLEKGSGYGNQAMSVKIYSIPEASVLWDHYIPPEIDQQQFLSGETVIVYLPELVQTELGYKAVNTFAVNRVEPGVETVQPAIQLGDSLTLRVGEKSQQVRCAYVMQGYDSMVQTWLDFLAPGTVLVSERLCMDLLELDEPVYNTVMAMGGTDLSYDVSDKLMSLISTSVRIQFQNLRLESDTHRMQLLTRTALLVGIAALLCVLSLVITYRNRMAHLEDERNRVWLLWALGGEDELLSRIYRRTSAVWIEVAAVINVLCLGHYIFTGSFRLFDTGSLLNDLWFAVRLEFHGFPWAFSLLPQVMFLFAYYFMIYKTSKKISKIRRN